MCLDKSAHGLVPQHPIFHTPFAVDLSYDTVPTPEAYRNRGLRPGEPLQVWHVQNQGYATKGVSPGVVSMGDGFADSPDAEVISGGVNHKSPTAVALGRQGPFFLWGFSAGPKDMTESGRRLFLNSIVYTAKFDRAPVLVRVTRDSRDRLPWMIGFIAAAKENHAEYLEAARKHNQRQKAAREKAKTAPEKLTDNEKFLLRVSAWPEETLEEFRRHHHFYTSFPPDVVKRCGDDATKYQTWYMENRPYLYGPRLNYAEVDEDAKALGIANHDPKLLDACVTALEQGKDVERATRLLTRYTGESFAKPAEWRAWLTASRADLFFSDMGGYRFFAKSGPDAGHRRALRALSLDEPTATSPVALTAVVRPASATVGEAVTVAVRMKIAPGWHTYASAGTGGTVEVTRLEESLPNGIKTAGDWRMPEARPERDGSETYSGDVVFLRTFRLDTARAGTVELPIRVSFQACNHEQCLPPKSITLTARWEIKPRASGRPDGL
jgi:hypothetical protein